MREQLGAVRVLVEEVVRCERQQLLGANRIVLCREVEDGLVGEEEPVLEIRWDRVGHVSLPEDATEGGSLGRVLVFRRGPDREDPPHANDDAPRVLRERCSLCVEEAERSLRLERPEERVQHNELVLALLAPRRGERQLRLSFVVVAQLELGRDASGLLFLPSLDVAFEHPSERHACRGVRRLHVGCFNEVSVRVGARLGVRMVHRPTNLEGSHEGDPLRDARRHLPWGQRVDGSPGARGFDRVVPRRADALQHQAAAVLARPLADCTEPAIVVPRDADGEVMSGELPRARDDESPPQAIDRASCHATRTVN